MRRISFCEMNRTNILIRNIYTKEGNKKERLDTREIEYIFILDYIRLVRIDV